MRLLHAVIFGNFLAACSMKNPNEHSEVKQGFGVTTVACELSLLPKKSSILTSLDARSCNDTQVQSKRDKDMFFGLCEISSALSAFSYRTSEGSCDAKGAVALCTTGDEIEPIKAEERTYYYHGQNGTASDFEAELKQFADSCKRLDGRFQILVPESK